MTIGVDISDARPEDEQICVGSWEWHIPTDEFHWSPEIRDLLAITDGSTVHYETFLQRIHHEDRQRVDREFRTTLTNGEPYIDDFRIQHPDGTVSRLHAAGRAIPRAQAQPERVRGVATDVTQRPSPGRGGQK
jgi:PAS domain-containing protein